jgi:uncharacterized membrane protein YgcG
MNLRTLWHNRHLPVALFLCAVALRATAASEYISSFHSEIKINTDASMNVTETIGVHAAGINIRHGIYRSFPTRYGRDYRHFVSFDVEQVLLDGRNVEYRIERAANGVHIHIGSQDSFVTRGRHTYTITYRTNRQLGFFDTHDELYWNVTPQDSRFSMNNVTAQVTLPESIPTDKIKAAAYVGYSGENNQNASTYRIGNGRVNFRVNRELRPYECLTIVVGWPKGIIVGPGILERIKWFLLDIYTVIFFSLVAIIAMYVYMKYFTVRHDKPGTIIPLFYPPDGFTPGKMRALVQHGYDNKCFAADVVNWAVNGFITISYDKGVYTLKRLDNKKYDDDKKVFATLFGSGDTAILGQSYNEKADRALGAMKRLTDDDLHEMYASYAAERGTCALVAFICFMLTTVVDITYYGGSMFIFVGLLYGFVAVVGFHWLRGYTAKGRALMDQIEGFRLFLTTTEKERMKMVGTPPTRTPELYEEYLPYAMALNVEDEWNEQFAPIFAQREQDTGILYVPHWYHGPSGGYYSPMSSDFASNLSSSLNSVISSASTAPGSSSGFGGGNGFGGKGGGGSSGGGGGGGGVGGW